MESRFFPPPGFLPRQNPIDRTNVVPASQTGKNPVDGAAPGSEGPGKSVPEDRTAPTRDVPRIRASKGLLKLGHSSGRWTQRNVQLSQLDV